MDQNKKIKILIGIPASGKSYWSNNFLLKNPNWIRVSRDDFRLMLRNEQMCEPKLEDLVTTLVNISILEALSKKLNVIIDNTNVKEKYIRQFIEQFKYFADIDYQVFDISLEKAIERDNNREMSVGENVIKRMYNDYKILCDSFDFQPIKKQKRPDFILPDKNINNQAVIVDMDGTLSFITNRSAYDFEKVMNDKVNWIIKEHIDFHKSKNRTIIICSGRDDSCKEETEMWLKYHEINYDVIFMRKTGDYRKDVIIKTEIYNTQIKDHFNVIACYDDRISVVKGWADLGLYTLCCNQGLIDF